LGIENEMESILLYPNVITSGDRVVIKGNPFIKNIDLIEIYNSEGKLLKKAKFHKDGAFWYSTPLHFEPGMYYVQVNNMTRKLLVL
jgi:hypothetical protein